MTTLADVAAKAGVSKSTVSRAFSRPESVRAETRGRVLATAHELAFTPNRIARSLAIGRTGSIGLFVPDIANPYFGPVIKTVQRNARRHDLTVFTADTDEHDEDEHALAQTMAQQADGLLLFSPRMSEAAILDLTGRLPVVVINRDIPGVPAVVIPSTDGMTQAVEHLAALGHRHIAYLSGPATTFSNRARRAAVLAATQRFGLQLTQLGPFEAVFTGGIRAGDLLIASGATAAIAYNDLIALGLMQRLTERGLRVGNDISVIGFDDIWLAPMTQPPLTTVRAPAAAAATSALRMLIDIMDGRADADRRPTPLASELMVRLSTGPVAR
ncbi:transcriptional regulator, LacI family [Modestobacter sp. DSM 44400]|uniref:LacI family DNA-binding transcriptional regulator n=1 Tax=Modestobacter sp. DSM 44400 TaxID=1550230 RepID=UPI00089AF6CA|nr:LacI family DNA-binding transcriptional regulator [Modestobacter sp. DSM 44400]SDY61286.1 transcriptional regulator, LacI family [Modestobacter sp. DSM 44400]